MTYAVTYFLEVGASALRGAFTATNLDKENYENLRFSYYSFKINTVKNSARKSRSLAVVKQFFLLVLFRSEYDGGPPIFRTVIFVHVKDNRLCCDIFLGRSSHRYKFEDSQ